MPDTEDDQPNVGAEGSDCTDSTKREWWRKSLISKIALESAQKEAKSKNGEYRALLKDAKKAGVNIPALTRALAVRFDDEDALVVQLREELKMLDLSGKVRNIADKILARFDIEEPTQKEAEQIALDRAWDDGILAGQTGAVADDNTRVAGTHEYDAWERGRLWVDGQRAIAEEMAAPMPPNAVPQSAVDTAVKHNAAAGRRKTRSKGLTPNGPTAEDVAEQTGEAKAGWDDFPEPPGMVQ